MNTFIAIYIFFSLVAIALLTYFLVITIKKKKECLCVCHGMDTEVCHNRDLLTKLYQTGQLTEYTDLSKQQRQLGGPKWSLSSYEG